MGVGNADLERALILVVLIILVVMLTVTLLKARPLLSPQVPPTVAPLLHPRDEEVRDLRHWRMNMDQTVPDLGRRVVRQEEQMAAVRQDLDAIKEATQGTQHMLRMLIEHGLKGERRE